MSSIAAIGFTGAQAASAAEQTAAVSAASAADASQLETVIVTAQRRSVNLQHEAVPVSAVSGDILNKANMVNVSGLNGYVPGLLAEKSSGSELMISIRGIGSETPQNLYTQPGVSVFVDGIYIPTALGVTQGFLDVDRVEVLRGPQGTLFGQSSTGGAISIVSKQPKLGEFGGDVEVSGGNYDLNQEVLDLNVPVSDTLAIRGVVQHNQHSGFAKNLDYPNYDLDDANDTNSKLSVLWKPVDNFSATLTARYYSENHNGAEQKNILDPNPNPRQVEQDLPGKLSMYYQIYSAALQWDLPYMTVKSVTGYQEMTNNQTVDDDRLDSKILGYYDAQAKWTSHSKSWTQELDLVSKPGGPLDWIAGVFYISSKQDQYIAEFRGSGTQPSNFYIPPVTGPSPANVGYEEYSVISRESVSPFFQLTYHLSDKLRLTGGARYNYDKYTGQASFYYSSLASVPKYSAGTWTGKAAVEYDLTPNNLIYASWTRGYKPGGINNAYNGYAVVVKQDFKTETVDSYEVGAKNEFLDHTLRLNVAAFYSKYNNMQYLSSDPVPYQDGTANIPKTTIWGGEFEGSWLGFDKRLRVTGNLTALGGSFDDTYYVLDAQSASTARHAYEAAHPGAGDFDPGTIAAVAAAIRDTKGNEPPKLPHLSGSVNVGYTLNIGQSVITPSIEYVYRGSFIYRVFNESALDKVKAYGVLNMYVDYKPPVDRLHFTLAVTNVTDEVGISGRFTDPYGSGQTSNQYIAPRQVVLTAKYSF
ncbi:MAG: TonB-dependent receptor [Caulobacteraceae bacterium]|nr:TonB-dependent receptor [Caulobacteraceae bacterium]